MLQAEALAASGASSSTVKSLDGRGLVEVFDAEVERRADGMDAEPAAPAEPLALHPAQTAALAAIVGAVEGGRGRDVPAARRHRLGQDRGLPPRAPRHARPGPDGHRARPRDRADAPDRPPLPGPLRRPRGRPSQPDEPGRAARRLDADPRRRLPHRDRAALGRLRALGEPGPGRGRRGARGELQAVRPGPALPRPRRGRDARPPRRRRLRAGQRDAVDGVGRERERGQVHAPGDARARARPRARRDDARAGAAAARPRARPGAREARSAASRGRCRTSSAQAIKDRLAQRRADDPAPEPPRLRPGPDVRGLRLDARCAATAPSR